MYRCVWGVRSVREGLQVVHISFDRANLMSGVVPRHRFAERARAQRHARIHHSHPSGELRPLHPMPGLEVLFSFFS